MLWRYREFAAYGTSFAGAMMLLSKIAGADQTGPSVDWLNTFGQNKFMKAQ